MIKIFHGNDRVRIAREVKKILGENYEVFYGENLKTGDIINIFKGASLFAGKRKILLKDLTEKRSGENEDDEDLYEEIAKYADTEHDVVIWETTLSKKKTFNDFVKKNNLELKKIDVVENVNKKLVFGIFDTAMRDGERAVRQLEKIEEEQDPYRFFGLMVSQALKRYGWRNGSREKAILKELAELDIKLKSTTAEPWILIKSFLIRMPKN